LKFPVRHQRREKSCEREILSHDLQIDQRHVPLSANKSSTTLLQLDYGYSTATGCNVTSPCDNGNVMS
jgi:hypothetical protein